MDFLIGNTISFECLGSKDLAMLFNGVSYERSTPFLDTLKNIAGLDISQKILAHDVP